MDTQMNQQPQSQAAIPLDPSTMNGDERTAMQDLTATARSAYPGTNHEIIEKALYCNKHGDTESVESWLDHLRDRLTLAPAVSVAASDVILERLRQQDVEGWTPDHDDSHAPGDLARAATCYARSSFEDSWHATGFVPPGWPLAPTWWKPSTPRRDLVKAGALILAEIDRIDRTSTNAKEDVPT
jgi:hypothetical protein